MRYFRVALLVLAALPLVTTPLAAQERISYLVRFGLTDRQPTNWDGRLSLSPGRLIDTRSWRPRGADQVPTIPSRDQRERSATSWKLATTPGVKFTYRNWEPKPSAPVPDYLYHPGLFITIDGSANSRLAFQTPAGDFSFRAAEAPAGERRLFLGGAISVERAAPADSVSGPGFENGFADIVSDGGDGWWVAWIGYKDWSNRVFVRHHDGKTWGEIQELTGPSDIYLVRLAADGKGDVWAVWSDRQERTFDLWARRFDGRNWSAPGRLTDSPQPDIHQALATGADGSVWLVWQGFRGGRSQVLSRRWQDGRWSAEEVVSTPQGDDWNPAVATDGRGGVWVAWDTYDKGDYDVVMRGWKDGAWGEVIAVADTPRYEAYSSLVCDSQGRVWAAWNESDMQWGKDTGFLVRRPATQLYQSRWIKVAAYVNGQWREPLAGFEQSLPQDLRGFNDFPRLETDGAGRVWALFRHRFLKQREVPYTAASHRAAWESFATAFDGKGWTTPIPLPATQGRSDAGFGFARNRKGELRAAWATDNRIYDEFFFEKGEILSSALPAPRGAAIEPRLRPKVRDELRIFSNHPNEAEDIRRIRDYTIESGGRRYKIYRGDTHRHTEYSHDGNNDGSLNDTYRYALNAVDFDFLGLSEHNSAGGPDIEYVNWLLQQRVDVFMVPGRFTPLYGYERSLNYPQGHRNVMFAKRGNPTLPVLPNENQPGVGAKPLYAYLKKYGGISIPHTSATGMGTDWRDNDPEVEPVVEIYQGDRVSAEYEGAPRAAVAHDVTTQAGGFRPKGYVWNAWAKGYKLGVQASSDHLSTHISYSMTIAEDLSPEGLLQAMKKRHSYAATDNIILDYRLQTDGKEYLQGDIVRSNSGQFRLHIKAIGTGPIRQIDIIRNNEFVLTLQNQPAEVDFTYLDQHPVKGESYYYVRIQQADEQIAWSSPIWIQIP